MPRPDPARAPAPAARAPRDWTDPARWLGPALLLLLAALAWFEFTDLDLVVQDRLFNFQTGRWLVDADEPVARAIFYVGPKYLVILTGVVLLTLASGPAAWRTRLGLDRRGLWIAVLMVATLPALAGTGKALTNMHCPWDLRRYGGTVPYVKLFQSHPADDLPATPGNCYPAGHSSGGFAFLGLAWLRPGGRWRRAALLLGLGLGWWMGGYQMLKGAHYLSHTLTTMLLAIICAALWHRLVAAPPRPAAPAAGPATART